MSEYTTREGDTFDLIARNLFGDEQAASLIAAGNPGVVQPLTAGLLIFTPDIISPFSDIPSNDEDEVSITIEGAPFRFFESVTIQRVFDGIDSASFTAPFDPDDPAQRENFRPFSYKRVTVSVGGVRQFTGAMVGVSPDSQVSRRTVTITAYALAGVLQDCTAPASSYPIEFNNLKLDGIAGTLLKPFGLTATFESDPGPVFDRVAAKPGQTLWNFLMPLSKQRNLVMGNDQAGNLVFRQSNVAQKPSAILIEGQPPLNGVSATFEHQKYYSSITGIVPMLVGLAGPQHTVPNTQLSGKLRPFTFTIANADDAEAEEAVNAKIGYMFGQMASYNAEVIGWRTEEGKLWSVGDVISLRSKSAMIYEAFNFIIRGVTFSRTGAQKSASLNLVLPGSYSGEIPESLPWD